MGLTQTVNVQANVSHEASAVPVLFLVSSPSRTPLQPLAGV